VNPDQQTFHQPPSGRRSRRPDAIRMARLGDPRKRGFCCYLIEVSEADIDRLVRREYLDRINCDDPAAVERAIGAVLDRL